MNMKLTTALALMSLTVAGVACSEPKPQDTASAQATAQTDAVQDEYTGTLNLNLPSTSASNQAGTGSLNLRIGQNDDSGNLMVGRSGFGGGNFQDAPQLELSLNDSASASEPQDQDDIIRLDPKK
ncbi:hypothetical protein HY3_07420 [Hyphomonas pacifica]|uniref:Uncharacterized protein n=2 Tax=Hyphomonas pacifica TaxID=1280941 RepID=A0A062TSH2_9PROT|nr:hypothetical protein HY2_06455 [Hyphomonas pacifica]RAN35642.1 hypothetical protein HY3_07420 [Hyphomonas pacifica]